MKRVDKIKLLKGLMSGTKTVNDLIPPKVRLFIKRTDQDFYDESGTGLKHYVKDKNELQKLFPRDTISIIIIQRNIISKPKT